MLDMCWSSPYFGVIRAEVNRILQLPDLKTQLISVRELVFVHGSQFHWNDAKKYRELTKSMIDIRDKLPLIEVLDFVANGESFKFERHGDGNQFGTIVKNSKGKVVLIDGPRNLYAQKSSQKLLLTSSLVATFTDPQYRNYGLYQQMMKFYSSYIPQAEKMFLVSENKETLEFAASVFESLSDNKRMQDLLRLESLKKVCAELGIKSEDLMNNQHSARIKLGNFLLFLSLQGKSRLRSGWTLEFEDTFTGKFWSNKLNLQQQKRFENLVAEVESEIRNQAVGFNKVILDRLFSSSYVNHLSSVKVKTPVSQMLRCEAMHAAI